MVGKTLTVSTGGNQGFDMFEDNLEDVGSRLPTKVVWNDGRFQRVNDWDNAKKPIWFPLHGIRTQGIIFFRLSILAHK